ncbi:TPA: hypothetical protein DDY47_01560 [candidate division WWE3 bacterium]|nr:MAG: hypothetical protein A2212_03270 [candidate division WWE3 bacterium RIFOXYA1_FULL_42_9]OGC69366.1 MAG: hypothetical protein A2380_00155 [candidate division WWE3 bacterium RIFOXYB1_FULL_43_24]OGC73556.1 MAG: hypothetical protein A2414_01935 [candidate division WWE3 bacterium RIFOXYC1_FULL_42_13]HBI35604.1 hypothetical protein [candidate division WWE3 bacterium]
MILPEHLFDYLGLDENERPAQPNVIAIPLDSLEPGKTYFTKKGKDLVPFVPKWGLDGDTVTNPGFGAYQHYVQASIGNNGEIATVDYDFYRIADGALDSEGNGTPGAVVFPVFFLENNPEPYIGFFLQWRPVIKNLTTGKHGCWAATVPGGFGKLTKLSGDTAREEAAEEFGAELLDLRDIGYASDNRAKTETPIRYMLAQFRLAGNAPDDSHETIFGKFGISFWKFPLGADGIINTAWAFAASALMTK